MMRLFFIVITSFIFLSNNIKGQTYTPLVKEGANWIVSWTYGWPGEPYQSYSNHYKLQGDTIINTHTYKILYDLGREIDTSRTDLGKIIAFLREDSTKKVFVLHNGIDCFSPDSFSENLLYDFGMVIGDTIYYPNSNYSDSIYYALDMIDTITISGHQRVSWTFSTGKTRTGVNWDYWIEGIGSILGMFNQWCDNREGGTHLGCYYDDVIYFRSDTTRSCQSLGLDEIEKYITNFNPNPTSGPLHIDLKDYHTNIETRVYNTQGQLVDKQNFVSVNEIDLVIDEVDGLYFIQIIGEDINQSLRILKK